MNDLEPQSKQPSSVFTPELAALDSDGDDGFATTSKGSGATTRYAVVACVLAVGVALLYFMRQAGGGPATAAADVQIDYQFAEREAAMAVEEQERVIDGLRRSGEPSQLPPEAIGKNPFRLRSGVPVAAGPDQPVIDEPALTVDPMMQRIEESLASLKIQAVIDGRIPIARISGETYREGDRIDDVFTIVRIGGRAVELESERGLHRLEMQRDGDR